MSFQWGSRRDEEATGDGLKGGDWPEIVSFRNPSLHMWHDVLWGTRVKRVERKQENMGLGWADCLA